MARITVEDCIERVPNRFEMILLAAHRARQVSAGAEPTLKRDGDKGTVLALREIAEGTVDPAALREGIIRDIGSPRIIECEADAADNEVELDAEGEDERDGLAPDNEES